VRASRRSQTLLELERADALWAYVRRPAGPRVTRVASDPVAGLDIFADDLKLYAGKSSTTMELRASNDPRPAAPAYPSR